MKQIHVGDMVRLVVLVEVAINPKARTVVYLHIVAFTVLGNGIRCRGATEATVRFDVKMSAKQ